jgi:predicted ATP-binding protein involved in virulence
MPLMRLIAENIGPFERLDIDFSDGNGKPHRGPHILAGVNGSGKSTVLRAIAWALSLGGEGFPEEDWKHSLRREKSWVMIHVSPDQCPPYGMGVAFGTDPREISQRAMLLGLTRSSIFPKGSGLSWVFSGANDSQIQAFRVGLNNSQIHPFTVGAYAPARALSYIDPRAKIEPPNVPTDDCLGFESTVQNLAIQHWLVDLFSRRALAKEKGQEFDRYEQTIKRCQDALELVCGEKIRVDVELGVMIEPRVISYDKKLNFSQLSDGVRTTMGWLADFMMRQDQTGPTNGGGPTREGLLLLDEIDIYLHPKWQRTLLPAMRTALPDVQIIASSHSPFVISSCQDARLHVLELDGEGIAHASLPQAAPFGESVTATLRGIFNVESRFDVRTERDLREWDNLKREEAVGKLAPVKRKRLESLSDDLSERSEELRMIVKSPSALQAGLLNSLVSRSPQARPYSRPPKRNGKQR